MCGVAGVVHDATGIAPHVVSWSQALHHMWYCGHSHCAMWYCGHVVAVVAPCGATVTITIVAVIAAGGWAVVGPGRRGQLCVCQQGGWWGSMGIGQQKRKLAEEKKKEDIPAEGKMLPTHHSL